MDDALKELAKASPYLAVMVCVIAVLTWAVVKSTLYTHRANSDLVKVLRGQIEFMRGLLGGKHYRKVDSDEVVK